MFFWFKTPKITVDAFTSGYELSQLFPPEPAGPFTPKWFNDTAPTVNNPYIKQGQPAQTMSTIKYCPGFKYLYDKTWVLRAWSEFILTTNDNNTMEVEASGKVDMHPSVQYGAGFKGMVNAKLISPWVFREKTGVMFAWIGAAYNRNDQDYQILDGIIDFKYQGGTNVNLMLPCPPPQPPLANPLQIRPPNKYQYTIKAGTPLVLLAPMTEKEVDFKVHCVSEDEYQRMGKHPHSKFGAYYASKKFMQEREEREAARKKCPFGFGK
jgi:hypothetical protein